MRYFGGMSVEETAEALGVHPTTVKTDWRMAKMWLKSEISPKVPMEAERLRRAPAVRSDCKTGRKQEKCHCILNLSVTLKCAYAQRPTIE